MAEIGRMIGGRYRLIELLGEGTVATVYRAADVQLDRDVAVKLLRPELSGDPDFLSEFRWQTRAAAALSNENVVAIYDSGTDASGTYVIMEYVDGADLATLLERNGPVPPRRAARATAICRPTWVAHGRSRGPSCCTRARRYCSTRAPPGLTSIRLTACSATLTTRPA